MTINQGVRAGNHQTKPPLANGHHTVMLLRQAIALYDMRLDFLSSLQDCLGSSRNVEKVMMITTVSTDQVTRVEDNPTFVELGVTF
jgi:hypothetical protein